MSRSKIVKYLIVTIAYILYLYHTEGKTLKQCSEVKKFLNIFIVHVHLVLYYIFYIIFIILHLTI